MSKAFFGILAGSLIAAASWETTTPPDDAGLYFHDVHTEVTEPNGLGESFLRLIATRVKTSEVLSYRIEASPNMIEWAEKDSETSEPLTEIISATPVGTRLEEITVQDRQPIDSGDPSRFLRMIAAKSPEVPNVLIILADDMGYSDLGCMGGDIETPHLDTLAENGILFPNFYNNAKCAPSRASLMTGQSNIRTGALHGAGDVTQGGMTIAEALKGKYTNLMIDKWHIKPKPLELGFERYFGSALSPVFWWPTDEKTAGKMRLDDRTYTEADMTEPVEDWYLTVKDTDYAIQFMEEDVVGKDKPFFMYYASHAPHWPLQAPRADVERFLETYAEGTEVARQRRYQRLLERGLMDPDTSSLGSLNANTPLWESLSEEEKAYYRLALAIHSAMVYRMDQELGRLFDYLKEKDLFDNTVIFFMSDNGASAESGTTVIPPDRIMGDRGTESRLNDVGASVCNTPMRGHKSTLYEGGVSTPMIFHWPDGIGTPGIVSRQVGQFWDLFPTILDLAALYYPSEFSGRTLNPLDGESLWPHILTGKETERTLFWDYEKYSAIRIEKWKALRKSTSSEIKDAIWQLYDLSLDRTEMNDLASQYPETAQAMASAWEEWYIDVSSSNSATASH
ncbi:sulfatase-like hydrolase/transferase [Puniceicoccales bacterium CK1056]|uniref:Sulfatase-like hydrolase/transferase n=1 Tax=Oceanipulchritudo coccoides TaxID=2706888 RepID=A0A6B2LY03_9BACT|nr:sulfatase-like hydrolase/transferase [Oceanipulchritudo coccoides]NDV61002.1 sulfatase-like hydrolase/transferase [Oceanipulchritudo coccoides]